MLKTAFRSRLFHARSSGSRLRAQMLRTMKMLSLLLLAAFLSAYGAGYSQTVSLTGKDLTMPQIFAAIKKQTGYVLFSNKEMLSAVRPVSLAVTDMQLEAFLQLVLKDQPISFLVKDKTIILSERPAKRTMEWVAEMVQLPVTGRIVDTAGRPIPWVSLRIKGTTKGTSTDASGSFSLDMNEGDVLQISSVGFTPLAIHLSEKKFRVVHTDAGGDAASQLVSVDPLIIRLASSSAKLDQVQVIAYGTTSVRMNTGNVSTVRAEEITRQNVDNPLLALQGRVPGLEVTQVNGIAGGALQIRIRGLNTLRQGTEPLFVVDGVPVNGNMFNKPGYVGLNYVGGGINPFSLFNPADIESIDVLKDADATAIYGSRAANGVILITTRKGKPGQTRVNINFQQGIGNITRGANLMNTEQYLAMRKEAFANTGVTPTSSNAPDLLLWDQQRQVDWQDYMIGGTASYTNAQASVSGGTGNLQFMVGGGYNRQTTVFPGEYSDQKGSLHFSVTNTSANNRLRLSLSASFLRDHNQLPITDFTQFIMLSPNAPDLYNADGTLNWTDYLDNPFRSYDMRYAAKTTNLLGSVTVSYNLLPGLDLKTSVGYNSMMLDEMTNHPSTAHNPADGVTTGSSTFNKNTVASVIVEPQLSYDRRWGRSRVSVLAGATYQRRNIDGQAIYGDGYTDDGMLTSLSGAATVGKGETVVEEHKFASVFGRLTYHWDDKYLLNITARRDGSSRFGPGRQYGDFGAVGAGWIFSEERFVKSAAPWLSFGKLRASYGTSGNEPAGNYAFMELYDPTTYFRYGGGAGVTARNLPDAKYAWEVNRKAEAGLELGLFRDRILATASLYRNRSSNQLTYYRLPQITGFFGITANLPATIQNHGWEFTLNTTNIRKSDFEWGSSFNMTISRNKLIDYPGIEDSPYWTSYIKGKPINMRRYYRFAGVDPQTGDYQVYDRFGNITKTPHSLDDKTRIIDVNRRFFGGLQNSFRYKGFELIVHLEFVSQLGENYLLRSNLSPGYLSIYGVNGNQPVESLQRWQKPGDTGPFRKFSQDFAGIESYWMAQGSDFIVSDASFVRVKNASLSYRLPPHTVKSMRIEECRFFVQAQNLATITGYKGADPETQNILVLPPLRVITLGIQLNL